MHVYACIYTYGYENVCLCIKHTIVCVIDQKNRVRAILTVCRFSGHKLGFDSRYFLTKAMKCSQVQLFLRVLPLISYLIYVFMKDACWQVSLKQHLGETFQLLIYNKMALLFKFKE